MKNIHFKPLNLLYNILVAIVISFIFSVQITYTVGASLLLGVALGFRNKNQLLGIVRTGVAVEIWESDIEEAIFKDNSFINQSKDVSGDVLGGAVVHHPQSGGPGNVVKNRLSVPADVRKRTDTINTYALDEYTSDPLYIPNADTVQLSYDKRNSALGEDKLKLQQEVAENMLYNWSNGMPAGRVLRTLGVKEDGTDDLVAATAPGATGQRKATRVTDLQIGRTFLANENRFFSMGMNALVPSNLLAQMFPANNLVTTTAMASVTEQERRNGLMYKAQGFDIRERSTVLIVDVNGNIKAPGAASDPTDSEGILLWWGMAVERALGDIKFFEKLGDPQFYGDIYSFLVRMGGSACRTNKEGIMVLAPGLTA
ncbi:hypothetical protein [Mucilaginibacter sp. L3T2-6]|uniref:hypothetical protein n=1 Tax=Mucilaginibacter sp. L3T2-6 TaxID=3062491 RepID=UPI002675DC4E|nr:hypothetical protein [Mucilaginibacter sp. L3T2-6]MDO3641970.1 hypothetical protein [Mucilaginibacter sp. L3T2-6]MDV6214352.1 hypothetical protein [Mucilaginibacter sp. L3T2-6]